MSGPGAELAASRLLPQDILRVGAAGLFSRRLRAALSVLGVAIGIAALVAVVGISSSSRADLLSQLDKLGTNLLTVEPGTSFLGENAALPDTAPQMIRRIGPIEEVSSLATVSATVRRSEYIDAADTGGIAVYASSANLLDTLGGSLRAGTFLNDATARYPAVVLGSVAADRLGIDRPGVQVFLGGKRFTVAGILASLPLAPDVDRAAIMGLPEAAQDFGFGTPLSLSRVYVRADPDQIQAVQGVLGPTANPADPEQVDVSRPSDVLQARAEANDTLTALFLGLGLVALIVGGIGIANVMVISVLERLSEIGLRRALGATKRHVATQFLTESLILSGLGGLAGLALGAIVTVCYAAIEGTSVSIPVWSLFAGLGAALVIGAVAGLYPAMRAARLSPTEALRTI